MAGISTEAKPSREAVAKVVSAGAEVPSQTTISGWEMTMSANVRDKIEYLTLCVNKFAERHGIARVVACDYLHSNNGLKFLDEFYPEESTLSERIVVEDLDDVCRNNGGVPTW